MTERQRIADRSPDDTPYGHLLPVLRAEQARGNTTRDGWQFTAQDSTWRLRLRQPLDVEALLAEFVFPGHIRLEREPDGATALWDMSAYVDISASPPPPLRRPRKGLLAKVLGP